MDKKSAAIELVLANKTKPDVALAIMKSASGLDLIKILDVCELAGMQVCTALCSNGVRLSLTNDHCSDSAVVDLVSDSVVRVPVTREDVNTLETMPFAKVLYGRGFSHDNAYQLPNGARAVLFRKLVSDDSVLSYAYTCVTLPKVA